MYKTGIKNWVSSMFTSIPPTTTIASGFWACDPMELARAAGKRPRTAVSEVMTTGRSRNSAPRITDSVIDNPAPRIWLKYEIEQNAVLDGDPENRYEADGRGDRKRHPGQFQGPDATHGCRQDVEDHQQGVLPRLERRVEQNHDEQDRDRHDPQEALVRFLHLSKLARPFDAVALILVQDHPGLGIVDPLLGLVDRRGQVPPPHAELDRDVALVVLPIDIGGAGIVGADRGQLRQRNSTRTLPLTAGGVSMGSRLITVGSSRNDAGRRSTMS